MCRAPFHDGSIPYLGASTIQYHSIGHLVNTWALIVAYTIFGIPCCKYSIMGPKKEQDSLPNQPRLVVYLHSRPTDPD